jgi:serine O-acetyltransferase
MIKEIKLDLKAALEKDPAAKSKWEIFMTYSGFRALIHYRIAHCFYNHNHPLIAKYISHRAKKHTGIEIHPAAIIGQGVFIDHGVGLVIGETTEIGNNVTIYQGVTLGGTGKDVGKRHPTIEDDVMISAGAKVLGPVVIGKGSKIGAGSVVLKDVPPHCTVVGVPGRVVRMFGEKYTDEMDQKLPDPVLDEFARLNKRISKLEDQLGIHCNRFSITESIENDGNESDDDNSETLENDDK